MNTEVDRNIDRCGYEVSEKQYKIWEVELSLSNELLRVCNKHHIKIFAWAGTLLGAVRHKGFIPWDDDMDFAITREDFNKLIKVRHEFREPFFLQYALNDRRYFFDYIRLRNSNTTGVITWNRSDEYNNGIFIDIFVLDGVPIKSFDVYLMLLRRKFYRKIFCSYYLDNIIKDFGKPNFLSKLFHFIGKKRSYEKWYEVYSKLLASYTKKSNRLSLITHGKDVIEKYWCYKSDVNDVMTLNFENIELPVLKAYDSILRHAYGDYMKFPPVELRGKWHETSIIFEPDVPYVEYLRNTK